VITARYFLGTKLEAFKGRGKGDLVMSHDLEDLISVVDGRATIVDEVKNASEDLQTYIATEIRALLSNDDFVAALPGFLLPDDASQRRIAVVIGRLNGLLAV
jgi:hypothetical protein